MAQLFSQLTLGTSPPPAGLSGGWGSGSMRACLVSLTLQSLTIPPEDRGFLRALAQLRGGWCTSDSKSPLRHGHLSGVA